MNFKMKAIAATCVAMGSAGAFAACPATTTGLVDASCVIQATTNTFYLAGASAQAQAFNNIARSLFDTPNDVIQIKAGGTTGVNSHVAYYGVRGGAKTLLVYRNSGGSGAGIRQLVSNTTGAYDAILTAPAAAGENSVINLSACTGVTGSSGAFEATCSSRAKRVPDFALSDVYLNETPPGLLPAAGGNYVGVGALEFTKTGLQGFGVAANTLAYAKLQDQNIAEGTLPSSCDDSSADRAKIECQPSIRKADYASVASVEGFLKTAAELFNDASIPAATVVNICRRTDTSGTQASSNLFFLNNVSGLVGYKGALNPQSGTDGDIVYTSAASSDNVKACLNNASQYALGVLSLESFPGSTEIWKFVKIDGVSPNVTWDLDTSSGSSVPKLVSDPKNRQQFAKGAYPFALESIIAKRKAPLVNAALVNSLYAAMGTKIADSTQSDLAGFAYLDIGYSGWNAYDSFLGAPANLQSRVRRDGNNSQPMIP